MYLRLQRSLRRSWLGAPIYVLAAHIEVDADDARLIAGHGFAPDRIWTAPIAAELEARADAAFDEQKKLSFFRHEDTPGIVWANVKGIALLIRARTAFHVTLADLIAGTVIEAPELAEIVAIANAATEAFDGLQAAVNAARSFEDGHEAVFIPEDGDDGLAPPATWPQHMRRR